jgi:hypothetical protein
MRDGEAKPDSDLGASSQEARVLQELREISRNNSEAEGATK